MHFNGVEFLLFYLATAGLYFAGAMPGTLNGYRVRFHDALDGPLHAAGSAARRRPRAP